MAILKIIENKKLSHIEPEVYGHFSEHLGRCIYEGMFVGDNSPIPNENGMRTDVVEALKEMKIPVLRWPGGCFADEYHWMDGIGPREKRKKMINTHWGGVVEDNSFGTHEFFELARQLGCKTYVSGNVGSGTVREMSEWVEYITFNGVSPMAELRAANGHPEPWTVNYWGVGNENWGCGGNMRPQYYCDLYRQYQTYVRNYDSSRPIRKIACGPNGVDYNWTEKLLETAYEYCSKEEHGRMDGLSLHYYTISGTWDRKGRATVFTKEEWYEILARSMLMDELIEKHGAIMDRYDPEKKIAMIVDEWGTWYEVEPGTNPGFLYQQNTLRDALVAAVTLNIFNKHSDRVRMACLAQTVNVLQAVILTEGERMLRTPTYHTMRMYRHHQNADLLESALEDVRTVGLGEYAVPMVHESVSVDENGVITVTLANLSADSAEELELQLQEQGYRVLEAKILCADEIGSYNTFDDPDRVCEKDFGGVRIGDAISLTLPAASVVALRLSK